jgi:hypothetical protein
MLYCEPHVFWIEWQVAVPPCSRGAGGRPGSSIGVFSRCVLRRRQPDCVCVVFLGSLRFGFHPARILSSSQLGWSSCVAHLLLNLFTTPCVRPGQRIQLIALLTYNHCWPSCVGQCGPSPAEPVPNPLSAIVGFGTPLVGGPGAPLPPLGVHGGAAAHCSEPSRLQVAPAVLAR